MEGTLQRGEALRFGWRMAIDNVGFFIATYFVMALLQAPPAIFAILTAVNAAKSKWTLTVVFALITVVLEIFALLVLFVGYAKAASEISAGYSVMIGYLRPSASELWRVFIAATVWFTGIGIGLIFCIVPGIWVALKYWPFGWLIVDQDLGPLEALSEAGRITTGKKWNLLIFFILCGVILLIGTLAFLVGLVVAFPTVLIATTFVVRRLAGLQVAGVESA